MRTLILLLLVALCGAKTKRSLQGTLWSANTTVLEQQATPKSSKITVLVQGFRNSELRFCDEPKDLIFNYRIALYDFAAQLYKKLGERSQYHFVYSPLSIWRILAAIAEGAESEAQEKMFNYLNVPSDLCTRQWYYNLADKRIASGPDATIRNTRTLIIDESVKINQDWLRFVLKNSMLDVVSSPIKKYPLIAAYHTRQVAGPLRGVNLDGNSIISDTIDYDGWWNTAFDDAVIQRAPFHDQAGKKIGAVDLMTVKRYVRMGFLPSANAKTMELPVGVNNRYRMVFSMILDNKEIQPIVNTITAELLYELLETLQESRIPLDVAIPRFTMTSNIDVRSILEEIGFPNLWTDPAATRYVSKSSALPSSFVQRASLTMRNYGVNPNPLVPEHPHNASTGLDPLLGRDFIADRPFVYALLDAETYTFIMSAAFTQPTYPLVD